MLRWMFALALMFSFQVDAQVDRCDRDLLPDGDADCDYRIVPYASIAYTGGQLELQYPERYTARQLIVAEDWFRLLPYRQGKALPIVFSDKAQRYDLIGRFSDRETGEQFLGLTPVACRDASGSWVIPVPDGGCAASREVEGTGHDDVVALERASTRFKYRCVRKMCLGLQQARHTGGRIDDARGAIDGAIGQPVFRHHQPVHAEPVLRQPPRRWPAWRPAWRRPWRGESWND